ncbi:MAG: S9 family peptidase [Bacteroidales bacterium]|nr:S9 family peptidase [Bacteroidales bacterium]
MRIIKLTMAAALAMALSLAPKEAQAQKKPLDHDVYDSWQSVSGLTLSDDGSAMVWSVNPQEGDGTLYARKLSSGKASKGSKAGKKTASGQLAIPRGYQPTLSPDGQWLVCRIKPEFAKTRQERIAKKKKDEMAKDTLAVVNLTTMEIKKFPSMESYSTGKLGMPFIAYKSSWKAVSSVAPKGKMADQVGHDKKGAVRPGGAASGLILLRPGTWQADTLKHIDKYTFNNDGTLLALTSKKDKKDSLSATAMILASYPGAGNLVLDTLKSGAQEYFHPAFDDAAKQLAFTATTDSNKTGSKRCAMFLAARGMAGQAGHDGKVAGHDGTVIPGLTGDLNQAGHDKWTVTELIPQGTKVQGTDGWTLTENSDMYFTPDGQRIMTGIAPIRPPKDTTIVDFETARLDIWNWDAPLTPPQQKKRLDGTLRKTYAAVINLGSVAGAQIIPLTTSFFDSVRPIAGGKTGWAISRDNSEYVRESVWKDGSFSDYYLVNLNDGSRKTLAKNFNASRFDISPEGKYLIWFDPTERAWKTRDIATGVEANLTGKTGVAFHNEEDDHPTLYPGPYEGMPKWLEGDNAVLIVDRYDVWKFAPDGSKAENLTGGTGRQTHNRFRVMDFRRDTRTDNERRSGVSITWNPKEELFLSVLNEDDKKNGYGRLSLAKPAKTLKWFTDTFTFQNPRMSPDGTIAYLKGNFRNPFDLYTTSDFFATSTKLTAINPQMKDYRWGEAELFEWKAYDGTPLKGLVFIPEGIKPGEKLPVMIYFYEKYSDQLYNFWSPAPSRSTVNLSFYTSRGYVVFVPDIVYKDGHPGESSYNCICSGAEALCEKYPFADKTKMAIQGQSWGGYQTAWLVTRTNMFAAAGAGAPVGNMTSAYGGIRWESGMTRAGQYEHGQSRIGKTLWDEGGLDLYIENSPIFHADKVQTPLLIMHNDNDGAVPWYQGIEYFSDLRRLGKPGWLLEYNDEAHNLVERRNCKDLSKRLSQFFDHYLKGEPMPAWMKSGVPTDRKGEYFGFEY